MRRVDGDLRMPAPIKCPAPRTRSDAAELDAALPQQQQGGKGGAASDERARGEAAGAQPARKRRQPSADAATSPTPPRAVSGGAHHRTCVCNLRAPGGRVPVVPAAQLCCMTALRHASLGDNNFVAIRCALVSHARSGQRDLNMWAPRGGCHSAAALAARPLHCSKFIMNSLLKGCTCCRHAAAAARARRLWQPVLRRARRQRRRARNARCLRFARHR